MPYAAFVAPALLASSAMNGAVFDSTFNVFFKLKFARLYDSVLATPLGPVTSRSARSPGRCSAARSTRRRSCSSPGWPAPSHSWWALLAVARGHVHRLRLRRRSACSRPRSCGRGSTSTTSPSRSSRCSCSRRRSSRCRPTRTPCSGWSQLTPLYHGVALERGLMLGEVGPGLLVHVLYLAVLGAGRLRRHGPADRAAAAVLTALGPTSGRGRPAERPARRTRVVPPARSVGGAGSASAGAVGVSGSAVLYLEHVFG